MILAAEDAALFYRAWGALLSWVNDRRAIVPSFPRPAPGQPLDPERAVRIRDVLWADDSLREQFLIEGAGDLSGSECELIASWKHRVRGDFVVHRHLQEHSIFMSDAVYGVRGIYTPLRVMFPSLPRYVGAVLLPFRDAIITDGLVTTPPMHITFGASVRRTFAAQYSAARAARTIITRLPPEPVARAASAPGSSAARPAHGGTAAGGNAWCERLGIAVPSVAAVRAHPDASTYALLIVTLLEHGRPMTLAAVAQWFEASGVALASDAYRALSRCRPATRPVYRDGDLYAVDVHDDDLDRWAFRLGLRPPRVRRPTPPPAPPRPPPTEPLGVDELDRAWGSDANLSSWSAQRLALAVLDAHDRPMRADEVVDFVTGRTKWHRLEPGPDTFRRTGAAIAVGADGTWSIVPGARELASARTAVRDAIDRLQRRPVRATPEEIERSMRAAEEQRRAHADQLARLRAVIAHAVPRGAPRAAVLVEVDRRERLTLVGGELAAGLHERLQGYDVVCGVDVRATLRELGIDAGERRLAELGPPQKTLRLGRSGRTLTITAAMLIQGSCGIARPLADDVEIEAHLARGRPGPLRRRLEADGASLLALHQYGKLHGYVRLRRGFADETFPAPWHHLDEPNLRHLMREALARSMAIIAVVGSAPGWEDPWARAGPLEVVRGRGPHDLLLVDERGLVVDERDVQLARLAAPARTSRT